MIPILVRSSVFTQDIERGKRIADQIDSGMVFINHPTWTLIYPLAEPKDRLW
jgi:succinate-semialdehyde dehydrogenase/glutarate-semialdehyde dehydrogenase